MLLENLYQTNMIKPNQMKFCILWPYFSESYFTEQASQWSFFEYCVCLLQYDVKVYTFHCYFSSKLIWISQVDVLILLKKIINSFAMPGKRGRTAKIFLVESQIRRSRLIFLLLLIRDPVIWCGHIFPWILKKVYLWNNFMRYEETGLNHKVKRRKRPEIVRMLNKLHVR